MIFLKFLLQEFQLSPKELAMMININNPQQINSWINGSRKIPESLAKALSEAAPFKKYKFPYQIFETEIFAKDKLMFLYLMNKITVDDILSVLAITRVDKEIIAIKRMAGTDELTPIKIELLEKIKEIHVLQERERELLTKKEISKKVKKIADELVEIFLEEENLDGNQFRENFVEENYTEIMDTIHRLADEESFDDIDDYIDDVIDVFKSIIKESEFKPYNYEQYLKDMQSQRDQINKNASINLVDLD